MHDKGEWLHIANEHCCFPLVQGIDLWFSFSVVRSPVHSIYDLGDLETVYVWNMTVECGRMVDVWLAPTPSSRKVLGSNPLIAIVLFMLKVPFIFTIYLQVKKQFRVKSFLFHNNVISKVKNSATATAKIFDPQPPTPPWLWVLSFCADHFYYMWFLLLFIRHTAAPYSTCVWCCSSAFALLTMSVCSLCVLAALLFFVLDFVLEVCLCVTCPNLVSVLYANWLGAFVFVLQRVIYH